mmetsp:Transcript_16996/g.47633  ORF Transcript_16996/g.47633 Transcript_16996/m.47633 type:complete len:211 (+) Transcript_16996:70-702(+)
MECCGDAPRGLPPIVILRESLKMAGVGSIESSPVDSIFRQPSNQGSTPSTVSPRDEERQIGWRDAVNNVEYAREALRNGGLACDGELQNINFRLRWFAPRVVEQVLMVAFVQKRSRHWLEWRDRWACLTKQSLLFFKLPGNYQRFPTERILLTDMRWMSIESRRVSIATDERVYAIDFDRPSQARRWAMRMRVLVPPLDFFVGSEPRVVG